jgi:GNAT superfamily N-acetyltransferase
MELRGARSEDHEAIAAFTRETWPERDGGDYIPDIYPEWIEGEGKSTLVVDAGKEIAGIVQCVLLSEDEAWCQGMRVNPAYRGTDVSKQLSYGAFDWAREQGALVARNMVFSWNSPGLGQSRSVGFEPTTEFRFAHPEPDPDAEPELDVVSGAVAAWRAWTESDTRTQLRGLALDMDESWAMSELTRADMNRAADETRVFAIRENGLRGMAYRTREYDREREGETEHWAEYGVGSWSDLPAARTLFTAVARDAAEIDAKKTRVLIPESARTVSDAAYTRTAISDEPDFVLSADLTTERTRR